MLTMNEARERVARGAAFLDGFRPGWQNSVDVGLLSIQCECRCVLAQVFEQRYHTAAREIGIETSFSSKATASACNLGFHYDGEALDYKHLQDAWIEAIADRRLKAEPKPIDALVSVPVRA